MHVGTHKHIKCSGISVPENLFAVPTCTCGPYGPLHAFLIFSYSQEVILTAQFFMQHLINIPNSIRFSCKCMGSTVYVCQETSACPSPHDIHFFVNIGKFGVSYMYVHVFRCICKKFSRNVTNLLPGVLSIDLHMFEAGKCFCFLFLL